MTATQSPGRPAPRAPELAGLIPPDRSADLDQARRQLRAAEQDVADLHAGTGRWAGSIPGAADRDLRQAAVATSEPHRTWKPGTWDLGDDTKFVAS